MKKLLLTVLMLLVASLGVSADNSCSWGFDDPSCVECGCIQYSLSSLTGYNNGLEGYTSPADSYDMTDMVYVKTRITNTCDFPIDVQPALDIMEVLTADGVDVSDGQPGLAGLTEAEIFALHQAGKLTQDWITSYDGSAVTIPANGYHDAEFRFQAPDCGYFQIDLGAFGGNNANYNGECRVGWAFGWFRVLGCDGDVPEFGTLGAALALIGAGIFMVARRK